MGYTLELISQNRIILAIINLNSANILNMQSLKELNCMLDEIESPSNRALYYQKPIVFTSPLNSKCFCAGMDLRAVLNANTASSFKSLFDYFEETVYRLTTLQHRTIAMIHGHTIAGGFFVSMACDLRCGLNDKNIKIGITEIDVGIPFQALSNLLIQTRLPMFKHILLIS